MINWSRKIEYLLAKKYLRIGRSAKNHGCWCQAASKTQRYLLFTPEACTVVRTNNFRLKPLCGSSKIASPVKVEQRYLYYSHYQQIENIN